MDHFHPFSTYQTTGVNRRQVQHVTKMSRLLKCIWYNHGQCIQISTDMSGIGLGIREILAFEMLRILREQNSFVW